MQNAATLLTKVFQNSKLVLCKILEKQYWSILKWMFWKGKKMSLGQNAAPEVEDILGSLHWAGSNFWNTFLEQLGKYEVWG